jgi:hypothetical protein
LTTSSPRPLKVALIAHGLNSAAAQQLEFLNHARGDFDIHSLADFEYGIDQPDAGSVPRGRRK